MSELLATCVVLSPELLVVVSAFLAIVVDLFGSDRHRHCQFCAWIGLFSALAATVGLQLQPLVQSLPLEGYISHVLAFDPMALFLKSVILLLALGTCTLSYGAFREEARYAGEYYCMVLFATLGALVACSSQEFLTFFIAFELLSLPLYMLAGFRRYNSLSAEAGFKYFVTGALSSAIMLFGISWVYGSLGTTEFSLMGARLADLSEPPNALLVGMVLVLVGLAFKVSAAPFHNWAPDVYAGAPTVINTFLCTVPKAAMTGVFLRLFWTKFNLTTAVVSFGSDWVMIFAILSILSMFIGNLSALPQLDVKRLLAYSGVAQIGYLMLGLAACARPIEGIRLGAGNLGVGATLFYVAAYTFSNFLAWSAVSLTCAHQPDCRVERFSGLFKRSPLLALALLIGLMSLAGVPPLVGFVGKFALFRAIYQANLPFLVVFGILNSVISLYYYFKVLKVAVFEEPHGDSLVLTLPQRGILVFFLVLVLGLGLWPGLLDYCFEIATVMLP